MRSARYARVAAVDAMKTFAGEASETALRCIVIMSPCIANDQSGLAKFPACIATIGGNAKQKTASVSRGGFAFLFSCILSFYSITLRVTVLLPNLRASEQLGTHISSSFPLTPPPVSDTRY